MTQMRPDIATQPPTVRPLTTGDRAFLHFTSLNPGEYLEAGVVLVVDHADLTVADLRAHVAARLSGAPELTERLFRPPGVARVGQDVVWRADQELDLDYHIVGEELAADSGEAGLRAALDQIATRPLDLDRPLWRLFLVRGHDPDRVAVVYRFSHIHQDGGAMHQSLHLLFGVGDEPPLRDLPTYGPPHRRDYARLAAGVLRSIPRTRQLTSWGGPPRGEARHLWVTAELDQLRRIARRHGATVNDVYLAAISGALRAWSLPEWDTDREHRQRHHRPRPQRAGRSVHVAMPISLRTADERTMLSNYTFGVRLRLPCDEPDPLVRLARVAAQTRRVKAGGRIGVLERHLLDKVPPDAPARLLAQAASTGGRPEEVALVASNTGTVRGPYMVAGQPVSELIGMPPLFVGRQYLSAALFGLGSDVCAAFTASESVPRYSDLPDLWLADLAALDGAASQDGKRPRGPVADPDRAVSRAPRPTHPATADRALRRPSPGDSPPASASASASAPGDTPPAPAPEDAASTVR